MPTNGGPLNAAKAAPLRSNNTLILLRLAACYIQCINKPASSFAGLPANVLAGILIIT